MEKLLSKIITVSQAFFLLPAFIFMFMAGFPIDDYPKNQLQEWGVNLFFVFGFTLFPVLFVSFVYRMQMGNNNIKKSNIVGILPLLNILGILLALSIYRAGF